MSNRDYDQLGDATVVRAAIGGTITVHNAKIVWGKGLVVPITVTDTSGRRAITVDVGRRTVNRLIQVLIARAGRDDLTLVKQPAAGEPSPEFLAGFAHDIGTVLAQTTMHDHQLPGRWDVDGRPCSECAARARLHAVGARAAEAAT